MNVVDADQENPEHPRGQAHVPTLAVVSGNSEDDDNGGATHMASIDDEFRFDRSNPAHADELYDRNLDEEDEAYVYKHLRGGVQETVTVRPADTPETTNNQDVAEAESSQAQLQQQNQEVKVFKPRNSDAVLSCPCCFNIVCMDCQRHRKYLSQFRAMFVMGVMVDWNTRLVYDEDQRMVVPIAHDQPSQVVPPHDSQGAESEVPPLQDGNYAAVLCADCRTQVAVLDVLEEVYHFHGCLESS